MFNRTAYITNDQRARDALVQILEKLGVEIKKNKEDYQADIESIDGGLHEVEVKQVWTGRFPYSDIQIPYRKSRLHTDRINHWVFRNDLKQVWLIDSSELKETRLVKASRGQERFFYITISKAKLFQIDFGRLVRLY